MILAGWMVVFTACGPDQPGTPSAKEVLPDSISGSTQTQPHFRYLDDRNAVSYLLDYGKKHPGNDLILYTSMGEIRIRLYENTPVHRANFIRLIDLGFYDRTVFYRVIRGFVLQGGDSDDPARKDLKKKYGVYTLPSEFRPGLIHRPGALAATRDYDNNPEKRSSPYDFYLVHGKTVTRWDLDKIEKDNKRVFLPEERTFYETTGGAAHLDGEHTVFGQVTKGLDVINRIASVPVDPADWPLADVRIDSIRLVH